nr:MAG TPA: hypothetical protein [Caudoviricetes sp.]
MLYRILSVVIISFSPIFFCLLYLFHITENKCIIAAENNAFVRCYSDACIQ